jgi:N-methylhydantoinase A
MSYRLGIDVGGTFTDLLLFNEETGAMTLEKTPSTPADQSIGILNGIHKIVDAAQLSPEDVKLILHGTTVATNAVLEGKGALVGLITTKGFEQILHVARSQTPGPLAGWIIMQKPDPLAPLYLTRGVSARSSARGEEMTELDEAEVRVFIKDLHAQGIEALTVSLINSFANADHEKRIRDIANEMFPDLPVTISTEILPEFREYERCLTTVMNSYVRPKMSNYLKGIQEKLADANLNPTVNIVRSDGGVMSLEAAKNLRSTRFCPVRAAARLRRATSANSPDFKMFWRSIWAALRPMFVCQWAASRTSCAKRASVIIRSKRRRLTCEPSARAAAQSRTFR